MTGQTAQINQLIGLLGQLQNQLQNGNISSQMAAETNNAIKAINSTLNNQLTSQPSHLPPYTQQTQQKKNPQIYIKYFIGGILYSTRERDIEDYFKKVGNVIDVAVMRDKNSGRSRGFAFVTFAVDNPQNIEEGGDTSRCPGVQDLNYRMLNPREPHLVQGRAVEIRQSDGGKPSDSFIVKKSEGKAEDHSNDRERKRDSSRSRRRKR